MTAINSGIHEVPGVRVPLQTSYGSPPHAVFMYSTSSEGVTLQLRDADDLDEKGGLASVLARLQQEDGTLSISYQDTEMLAEGSIDVLLGTGSLHSSGTNGTASFDLFDSDNGQDLTLSPQTFTSSTEAFMNDNSDSLGVPGDGDTVGSTEDAKGTPDSSKLSVKKSRPKAASPNRQGPQQCQVCGKVFGNASALAKHKLTHSDERKYVCTMCGKAFKRQDHLNGHMLTHRNKKPYECKADGCGKSYCDARSLRRHTENHHTGNTASSTTSNRESSSPLASSCIQYAPPPVPATTHSAATSCSSPTTSSSATSSSTPASKAPSQLQQLLASDATTSTTASTSSTKSGSNDGLTKQQLDLIHQIMQQTQQHSGQPKVLKVANGSASNGPLNIAPKSGVLAKAKTWTNQSPAVGGIKPTLAPTPPGCQITNILKHEPKPVECNLCHRKFKNIPALNGHMRLHGGYFKKDSDAKKCEKKEAAGPPLQTASMSVRALIEEKIIQKRSSNTLSNAAHNKLSDTNGVRNVTSQVPSASSCNQQEPDLNIKLSSFVVPAPPILSPMLPSEKLRRHSDSEHFNLNSPRNSNGVNQEAQALADLLLKRGKKISVKRASSDPGAQATPGSPLTLSASSSPGPPLQLSFQTSDYSLGGVSYQAEDGGYFSPSLQEDVFQHVSADSMLLQSVDANQLAESLQFQASLLQDNTENLSLDEYQGAHNQDLQAVLNSPLPVSLAEFGAYGSSQAESPKDLQYQDSPLPSSKDFSSYVNSPHPSLSAASPLPSPITRHDSPSFTYPTPPASQEGHSPSFTQAMLSGSQTDNYVQSVISNGSGSGPVPVSSPLSAAFYTTTMSSSAAVEEALSEVLPMDSQNACNGPVRLSMYHPSPPPHSPLSTTPCQSPLSLSSVPASSSSVSSPLPQNAFNNTQNHSSFPLSPQTQQALQSQMMPNSDDPLLSSSPKDFASKKKFDFNGLHSFKLIGNGMVDLGNGGLGIVVDSNGELKIFQAASASQAKGLVMSSTGQNAKGFVMSATTQVPQAKIITSFPQPKGLIMTNSPYINTNASTHARKIEMNNQMRISGKASPIGTQLSSPSNFAMRLQRIKLPVSLDNIKEEVDDEVFLSPSRWASSPQIPASPSRPIRRRPHKTDPIHYGTHPCFQSRLRTPRVKDNGSPAPYTPAPMLSPSRLGQGLYWQAAQAAPANSCLWPTSTTAYGTQDQMDSSDAPPESSVAPRVNIGPRHQAIIPPACNDRSRLDREPNYEHLLWDPGISKFCTDAEIDMYLEFSCCAAVPGGGRNKEYALHLLHMCHYNIHEAMLKLMQPTPWLPPGHPLLAYEYAESDKWSADEVDTFHQGLLKFDKDFRTIAQEIGSKNIRQCIQFYYLWKKICPEEYKRLRLMRRRKEIESSGGDHDIDMEDVKVESSRRCSPVNDVDLVSTSSESRLFVCEYSDCSASFNSRAALSGHIRIHGGTIGARAPTPDRRGPLGDSVEEFPCKICGKVFNKVKSRSAHMKSHRPPDAEPKKPKLDQLKMDHSEHCVSRTMTVSSSGLGNKLV